MSATGRSSLRHHLLVSAGVVALPALAVFGTAVAGVGGTGGSLVAAHSIGSLVTAKGVGGTGHLGVGGTGHAGVGGTGGAGVGGAGHAGVGGTGGSGVGGTGGSGVGGTGHS